MESLKLHYNQPASQWIESLPMGNGRIGAMVFGGIEEEKLCLNEDTLWSGYPKNLNEEGRYPFVKEAKQLAKQYCYKEVQELIEAEITGEYMEAYMPFGNLTIKMDHKEAENYYRELDLNTAVHTVTYKANGTNYKRQMFLSEPKQAIVMRMEADEKEAVTCEIGFESLLRYKVNSIGADLEVKTLCPSHAEPVYLDVDQYIFYEEEKEKTGIRAYGRIHVEQEGGSVISEDGKIIVKGADAINVFMTIRSNFAGYDKHPELTGKPYIEPCMNDMEAVSKEIFQVLMEEHVKDYQTYYKRVDFHLGKDEKAHIPMDERLKAFKDTKEDVYLPVYLFHYGRYLTLASSRVGTQVTNLQGIWNDSLTPPWSSNCTININTEMNYWPVFMCNLGEMNQPLIQLIKDISVAGKETAQKYYNARGFVSHHNMDIWRRTHPVGRRRKGTATHGFWPMSSGWLCEHLFEQYEYTLDKKFLETTAFPIMKEAARFYLDMMEQDENGYYAMIPSTSPENYFIHNGERNSVSKTTTMTMAIIKELFINCIKASEILGKEEAFLDEIKTILPNLFPFQIGSDGRLLEWSEEMEESDILHRHVSHLYPLHPARLITPDKTPELAQACKKVLEVKGLTGTGWSLSWKVNHWARLYDGENALELIKQQLNLVYVTSLAERHIGGGSYPNLLDAHPPFQIDGNFGITSAITEMLMQSYEDKILILPALPKEWSEGAIQGLKAKGAITVDIEWKEQALVKTTLTFETDRSVRVTYEGKETVVQGCANESVVVKW